MEPIDKPTLFPSGELIEPANSDAWGTTYGRGVDKLVQNLSVRWLEPDLGRVG